MHKGNQYEKVSINQGCYFPFYARKHEYFSSKGASTYMAAPISMATAVYSTVVAAVLQFLNEPH